MTKAESRKIGLAYRNSLSSAEVLEKSNIIHQTLVREYQIEVLPHLLTYISFGNEVSTIEVIEARWKKGLSVLIPKINGGKLTVHEVFDWGELEKNRWGIWEPKINQAVSSVVLTRLEVIIIPGVAFDKLGSRVGFGKGYYDRLLPHISAAKKIAIAFHGQIVDKIEVDSHDIPMNVIITDSEIYKVRSRE
jgi:5-formyltetrahydrofolate cyclo-ligase